MVDDDVENNEDIGELLYVVLIIELVILFVFMLEILLKSYAFGIKVLSLYLSISLTLELLPRLLAHLRRGGHRDLGHHDLPRLVHQGRQLYHRQQGPARRLPLPPPLPRLPQGCPLVFTYSSSTPSRRSPRPTRATTSAPPWRRSSRSSTTSSPSSRTRTSSRNSSGPSRRSPPTSSTSP